MADKTMDDVVALRLGEQRFPFGERGLGGALDAMVEAGVAKKVENGSERYVETPNGVLCEFSDGTTSQWPPAPPRNLGREAKVLAPGELPPGFEARGMNPHYKPRLKRWDTVELIAAPGTEFGIVMDGAGLLAVVVRRAGESWPEHYVPDESKVIADGEVAYRVTSGDFGPARDHEFENGPDGKCKVCGQ